MEPDPACFDVGEDLLGLALHLVGELLDEPRPAQWIGDVDHAGLFGDDLLGAKRQAHRMFGGQRQCLVEGVGVQALGTSEHAGQGFDGHAHQVHLGLLGGERDPGGLGVEAQLQGSAVARSVAVAQPAGPDAPGRPVFGDLLEEVHVGVEEEGETGGEVVDRHARRQRRLDVGEPVGQGEGQFLRRRRAGFPDVVARDRDRVPPRQLGGGEAP